MIEDYVISFVRIFYAEIPRELLFTRFIEQIAFPNFRFNHIFAGIVENEQISRVSTDIGQQMLNVAILYKGYSVYSLLLTLALPSFVVAKHPPPPSGRNRVRLQQARLSRYTHPNTPIDFGWCNSLPDDTPIPNAARRYRGHRKS